jgi:hypothetical protein
MHALHLRTTVASDTVAFCARNPRIGCASGRYDTTVHSRSHEEAATSALGTGASVVYCFEAYCTILNVMVWDLPPVGVAVSL